MPHGPPEKLYLDRSNGSIWAYQVCMPVIDIIQHCHQLLHIYTSTSTSISI